MKKGAIGKIVKRPVDLAKVKRVGDLNKFLPRGLPGCRLEAIATNNAFSVFYPGVKPGSRTRTFSKSVPRSSVLRHVLSWAWRHHKRLTGTDCPYVWFVPE